jgi:hypothetical protein
MLYKGICKKNDRLPRDNLIFNYEDGGTGMIDIESKFKSLKVSWADRISLVS